MKDDELEVVLGIAHKEIYDDAPKDLAEGFLRNCLSGIHPYTQCFVAEKDAKIVGFIIWRVEDLYNTTVVVDIDLLAVDKPSQRLKIGTRLIEDSFPMMKEHFSAFTLTVTVTADEKGSKKLYKKVLKPYFESSEPFDRTHFYAKK